MLYNIFYYLLKVTCYIYFKKIRLYQTENIPSKKSLIICANHGNSFLDAILIAIFFKRKLHFLARADVFSSPFKIWFLSQLNMIPIYRIRDGKEAVKNNEAIFDKCSRILDNNGAILIFPEGTCVVERRLRAFKTGFVQLAFKAKAIDLQVLPLTINYSEPLNFYTEVSIDFCKPIDVIQIKNQTLGDYKQFSKLLIAETVVKISNRMVVIQSRDDDDFYEQMLVLTRNDYNQSFLINQLGMVKYLNEVKMNNLLFFNDLKRKSSLYFNNLSKHKIKDEAVILFNNNYNNLIFLVYPFYILGLIIHFLPTSIINYFISHKVKEIQFIGALKLVIGMFIYLIYIPLIYILTAKVLTFGGIFLIGFLYFYPASFQLMTLASQKNKIQKLNIDLKKQRDELVMLINP